MSKRLYVDLPVRRVRRKLADNDGEEEEDADVGASTSVVSRTGQRAFVDLVKGYHETSITSVQFDAESATENSDVETAPDTSMPDPGAEEDDAQTSHDFNADHRSSRSMPSRLPTPAPPLRRRRSSVYVDLPPLPRAILKQTQSHSDEDVVLDDDSAIVDRRTGLATPRKTKTPSLSVASPPDDEEEEVLLEYDPPVTEAPETEELVDMLDEINADAEEDEEDKKSDLPIRILDNFAIYQADSSVMEDFFSVALESERQLQKRQLLASGIVSPQPRKDENDEEIEIDFDPEDMPRIQLTEILEIDFLWWYDEDERLDPDIWIRTSHAWYILRDAHPSYRPYMRPFSLAHYVIYVMTKYALKHPRVTLDTFLLEVDSDELGVLYDDQADDQPLTREECERALQDARVLQLFDKLRDEIRPLNKNTLFRELRTRSRSRSRSRARSVASSAPANSDAESTLESASDRGRKRKRPSLKRRRSSNKNPELETLRTKPGQHTVLTPIVSEIAQQLRHLKLRRAESVMSVRDRGRSSSRPVSRRRSSTIHESNPEKIIWGRCVAQEDGTSYYDSVRIDGVKYKPGDLVMLEPGADPKKTREQAAKTVHTTNLLAHKNWFAQIVCLHDDGGRAPSFHARWFAHSSKTLLQEFSHPNELFWLKECSDCELTSILQKCELDVLPKRGEVGEEPPAEGDRALPPDHFFHRNLYYDEDGIAWSSLSSTIIQKALDLCPPHRQCISCGLDELDEQHDAITLLSDNRGFISSGIEYHEHECVYLYGKDDPNSVFDLAQIVDWKSAALKKKKRADETLKLTLTVRYFHRRDDLTKKERLAGLEGDQWKMDERHIFLTGRQEEISSDRLAGKFYLRRREPKDKNWLLDNPDVFYCTLESALAGKDVERRKELHEIPKNTLERCEDCFNAMMQRDERLGRVAHLNGLEIFAGGGGLSEGAKSMIDTRWVIEYSLACARTLGANHPDAVIFNQDCNKVLQYNIDFLDGCNPDPLLDSDGNELPPLPGRGEVDIIFGGPPCQSFSKANHYKKDDDPRSMLALVLLSYAELLEPDYIIIENVLGFVEHKTTLQDGREVPAGMVKIVVRIGLALGFQVHARVMQAAQHGVPQGRRRFIIIMARRGLPLPQHPLPTHVYKAAQRVHLPTGQTLRGLSRATDGFLTESARSAYYDQYTSAAPHHTITVEQATGDLPMFHWERPGEEIVVSDADRQLEEDDRASGIPVMDAISSRRYNESRFVGFAEPEKYGDVPRSMYQHAVRSTSGRVDMHYTMPYPVKTVERVTAVPMWPRANWRNLPEGLPARVRGKKSRKPPNNKMLMRVPADDVFATSMTEAKPLSQTGSALHYSQRRTMTVREAARAQGFPDDYIFCARSEDSSPRHTVEDQQRQIGNAVPVPLARALAEQCLRPALLTRHEQEGLGSSDEGSPGF
ncbi:unnamed protein product [Peniophora sp. CBMAI 1063]|nr:unnamed protein product [Peniophora sp. CBMAI 1063]